MTRKPLSRIAALCGLAGLAAASSGFAPVSDASATGVTYVSIVAHPDDDIFFMNPDIFNSLVAGNTQVTVILTGGNVMLDDYYYMHEREQGTRDSNGFMAAAASQLSALGITDSTPNVNWSKIFAPITPAFVHWNMTQVNYGGEQATQADCIEYPLVHLIFLHLPSSEQVDGTPIHHSLTSPLPGGTSQYIHNLGDLYQNPSVAQASMDNAAVYNHAALVNTLASILAQWNPAGVRTQDWIAPGDYLHPSVTFSAPPCLQKDPTNTFCVQYQSGSTYDHADHYWGAWFAHDAIALWIAETGAQPALYKYRGYNVEYDPTTAPTFLSAADNMIKLWVSYQYSVDDFHFALDNGFENGLYSYANTGTKKNPMADGTTRYEFNGRYGFAAWSSSQFTLP